MPLLSAGYGSSLSSAALGLGPFLLGVPCSRLCNPVRRRQFHCPFPCFLLPPLRCQEPAAARRSQPVAPLGPTGSHSALERVAERIGACGGLWRHLKRQPGVTLGGNVSGWPGGDCGAWANPSGQGPSPSLDSGMLRGGSGKALLLPAVLSPWRLLFQVPIELSFKSPHRSCSC